MTTNDRKTYIRYLNKLIDQYNKTFYRLLWLTL